MIFIYFGLLLTWVTADCVLCYRWVLLVMEYFYGLLFMVACLFGVFVIVSFVIVLLYVYC